MKKRVLIAVVVQLFLISVSRAEVRTQCLEFNSQNNLVNTGLSSLAPPWTLEYHVKREVAGPDQVRLLEDVDSYFKLRGYRINEMQFNKSGGVFSHVFPSYIVPESTWIHMAIVCDGSSITVYEDGVNKTSVTDPTVSISNLPLQSIGGAAGSHFFGRLDEMRVWNDVRTVAEIIDNKDIELVNPTSEPNLYLYYDFNEAAGTNVPDKSGNNRNGTLTNMVDSNWIRPVVAVENYGADIIANATSTFTALPALTGDWTVEVWVKSHDVTSNGMFFTDSVTNNRLAFNRNDGSVGITTKVEGQQGSGVTISNDTWAHIAWVYDSTAKKVTVIKDAVTVSTPISVTDDWNFSPNIFSSGTNGGLNAIVDEIRIWSVARDAATIASDYLTELNGNEANLAHYWDLEQSSGSTMIDRVAGGVNLPLPTNATWVDVTGSPVVENISVVENYGADIIANEASTFTALPAVTGDWTVEVWVKSHDITSNGIFFSDSVANNRLAFNRNNSVGIYTVAEGAIGSGVTISNDTWAHIAWVYNSTDKKVTVIKNGATVSSPISVTADWNFSPDSFSFSSGGLNAIVDEIRIWSVARDAATIASDYLTELNGNEANLVHYWDLEQSSGSTMIDRVAGGVNLPLPTNATWVDVTGSPLVDAVTPAIGIEIVQIGTELIWSVEAEIGVEKYQVVDTATNEILETIVADGSGSYETTAPAGVVVKLVVVDNSGYAQTFIPADGNIVKVAYDLNEGWNLIAMPGDNADTSEINSAFWGWNGSAYEQVETPEVGNAVWVYSPVAKQVVISAEKATTELSLETGWNLVGPTENMEVPAEAHTVYGWNGTYQTLADEGTLLQGVGYWIFSIQK